MSELGTLIATRNLFVNTADPLIGECRDAQYNLPQGLLQCNEDQHMRLTLNSFSIRNSWYRVNEYNSVIYMTVKYSVDSKIRAVRLTAAGFTGTPVFGNALSYGGGTKGAFRFYDAATQTMIFSLTATTTPLPMPGEAISVDPSGTVKTATVGDNPGSRVFGRRVAIPRGNYTSYENLCAELEQSLKDVVAVSNELFQGMAFPTGAVTWNTPVADASGTYVAGNNDDKITIKASYPDPFPTDTGGVAYPKGDLAPELKFVCFTINPYRPRTHSVINSMIGPDSVINANDGFQNAYELYGGCMVKSDTDATYTTGAQATVPSFDSQWDGLKSLFVSSQRPTGNSDPTQIQSYIQSSSYNATLQTEENIYLRTNLHSSSYQTAGFDTGCNRFPAVVGSQILAKIPLNNPQFAVTQNTSVGLDNADPAITTNYTGTTTYERPYEMVYFTDNGNNMYSILLDAKKVNNIRLFITDSFGRIWPAISQEQIDCGKLNFTCSLRIDVFQE